VTEIGAGTATYCQPIAGIEEEPVDLALVLGLHHLLDHYHPVLKVLDIWRFGPNIPHKLVAEGKHLGGVDNIFLGGDKLPLVSERDATNLKNLGDKNRKGNAAV